MKKPPREAVRLQLRPPICGVYFLVCHPRGVVYVGQSKDIESRVKDHQRKGEKQFDSIYYIEVSTEMLDSEELYWIRKLKPIYNLAENPLYRKDEWWKIKQL